MFPFTGQSRAPWSSTKASESELLIPLRSQVCVAPHLASLPFRSHSEQIREVDGATAGHAVSQYDARRRVSEKMHRPIAKGAEGLLASLYSTPQSRSSGSARVRPRQLLQAWPALQALQALEGRHLRLLQSSLVLPTVDRNEL